MNIPPECLCGVCGKVQFEPRLLQCRHSFCAMCITAAGNVAICPTCGAKTALNSSWGVLGLDANSRLEEYIVRNNILALAAKREQELHHQAQAQLLEQQQQEQEQFQSSFYQEAEPQPPAAGGEDLSPYAMLFGAYGAPLSGDTAPPEPPESFSPSAPPDEALAAVADEAQAAVAEPIAYRPDQVASDAPVVPHTEAATTAPESFALPPQQSHLPQQPVSPQQSLPPYVVDTVAPPYSAPVGYIEPGTGVPLTIAAAGSSSNTVAHVSPQLQAPMYPTLDVQTTSQAAAAAATAAALKPTPHSTAAPAKPNAAPAKQETEEKQGFLSSLGQKLKSIFVTEEDVTSTATGAVQKQTLYSHFIVTTDQANVKVNKWLSGLWFAPTGFHENCNKGPVEPMWVPFIIFNGVASSYTSYAATVEQSFAAEHKIDGVHEASYNNVTLCALDREDEFWKELINEFHSDWKFKDAKNPTSELTLPVPKTMAWDDVWRKHCRAVINHKEMEGCQNLLKKAGLFPCKEFSHRVGFSDVRSKLIYMPMYVTTYSFENQTYQVAVHGHSGKVHGARPYGAGKLGSLGNKLTGLFGSKKK